MRHATTAPTLGLAVVAPRKAPGRIGIAGRQAEQVDVLLVCSAGGHLLQLYLLRDAWEPFSRMWVTHDKDDARSLLADETVVYAYQPTTRNIPNLLRNLRLAWRLVRRFRPRVVVSTGAGIAVPFIWVSRLFGARVVFIESLTRVESPSLTFRLVHGLASRTYVQWPELASRTNARYVGTVYPEL